MSKKIFISLITFFLFGVLSVNAQNWNQIFKGCASDRAANDNFGFSVAVDGDYAIVGAYQEDEDTLGEATISNAGSAYVFQNVGGTWSQVQKIVASDRNNGDNFGYSVAISGNFIIVGAYHEDENATGSETMSNSGSAYIFENVDGEWTEIQKIVASDRYTDDFFGASVSISGDYAIVGAHQEDENATGDQTLSNSGSAYLFKNNSGTWTEVQKIVASDRGDVDYFGYSVSISGDYAIVGAYLEDENAAGSATLSNPGSAYIFKNNAGTWSQIKKLVASDRADEDFFGFSVAISGDYAIVGAYQEDENTGGTDTKANAGAAYIFGNNSDTWTQVQKIVAFDRGVGDQYGYSVSISGDYAVVGSSLEDEDENGNNNYFNAGSAYIYMNNSGTWTQARKLVPTDRANSDLFGSAVAVGGNYCIAGAYQEDHDADGLASLSNAGSAYIFKNSVEINVKQNTTNIADGGNYNFGHVNPGESSEILEFTIENSGADNLELSGTPVVTVSGANASDFVVDQTSISSTVLPAETTTFTIVFTPSASGSRIAEISINNNDADENPYNFTVTGNDSSNFVLENISDSIVSVYPNPTSGLVNFDFSENQVYNITITDITGKIVLIKNNPVNNETVDISNYSEGIYFVSVKTNEQIITTKLVKK